MLIERNLYKIKMQRKRFDKLEINANAERVKNKLKLSEKEVSYFVFQDNIINNAYNPKMDNINILLKNGETLDIKEAADKVELAPKPEKKGNEVDIPEELLKVLEENPNLKSQFQALSPYKQREYCEHIASAKQDATKHRRLSKIIPLLKKGIGLHDKYRNC